MKEFKYFILFFYFMIFFLILSCDSKLYNPFTTSEYKKNKNNDGTNSSGSISIPNPIGFYPFNGNCNDESGNGHNLTNFGAVLAQNRIGTNNSAYSYTSDYMETSTLTELNFTTELTISVWIYITGDPANYQMIICKLNAFGGYMLAVQNNRLYPEVHNPIYYTYNDGLIPLSSGQWYHVAMTWKSGGYLKTYVNGTLDRSLAVDIGSIGSVTDQPFTIGAPSWNRSVYLFSGTIDDIRIYPRELTANEVLYLHNLPPD